MSTDIWSDCSGHLEISSISGKLYRFVSGQMEHSTLRLVSSLADHSVLKRLLRRRPLNERNDLLIRPFRNPPLPHGSRFGQRHEPSLFYGSLSTNTVLAESAYYRFVAWQMMDSPPPKPMLTQHNLFKTNYTCEKGLKLHQQPFDAWRHELTDRHNYTCTQALGHAMRHAGIDGFEFISARDPDSGLNVALFHAFTLTDNHPEMLQDWFVETNADGVNFYCTEDETDHYFELGTFLVDGRLPMPAA